MCWGLCGCCSYLYSRSGHRNIDQWITTKYFSVHRLHTPLMLSQKGSWVALVLIKRQKVLDMKVITATERCSKLHQKSHRYNKISEKSMPLDGPPPACHCAFDTPLGMLLPWHAPPPAITVYRVAYECALSTGNCATEALPPHWHHWVPVADLCLWHYGGLPSH